MATEIYLIVVTIVSVQNTSERTPRMVPGLGCPPVSAKTVFRVLSGLVPISPKTTPRAATASPEVLRCSPGRLRILVWLLGKCDLPFRRVGVAAHVAEHGAPLAGSGNTIMMALKTLLCCPRPGIGMRSKELSGQAAS